MKALAAVLDALAPLSVEVLLATAGRARPRTFNLDQYLAMTAIEAAGAGVLVRSGTATAAAVRAAVERALQDPALRAGAAQAAASMRHLNSSSVFHRVVASVVDKRSFADQAGP